MGQNWKQALRIGGYILSLAAVFGIGFAAGRAAVSGTENAAPVSDTQPEQPVDTPLTFYSGTTVNGVDVGGMTLEQAVAAMDAAAVERDGFEVVFADETVELDGRELGWCVADYQPLSNLLTEQSQLTEETLTAEQLTLTVEEDTLYECTRQTILTAVSDLENLTAYEDTEAESPYLHYNTNLGAFQLRGGESVSGTVDASALADAIVSAVGTGETSLDVAEAGLYSGNNLLADGETAQAALEKANAMRNLDLTYEFGLSDGTYSGSVPVSRWWLRYWLTIEDDGLTVSVDEDAVLEYCEELANTYSDSSEQEDAIFVTTGGQQITVTAPVVDRQVDAEAMREDLLYCLENLVEGERDAIYKTSASGVAGSTDLGGTYVEVDMDSQHLYLYVDGELIADDDICSGDVATNCETPTGLYTFRSKQTERTLKGPTWSDFVYYWMPFYQDYGLHDATWRTYPDDFGGDVYLESGSHGCINMPIDLAETVYNNIEVGDYIILYGGER